MAKAAKPTRQTTAEDSKEAQVSIPQAGRAVSTGTRSLLRAIASMFAPDATASRLFIELPGAADPFPRVAVLSGPDRRGPRSRDL